jgi:[ribosomal protein S18]-alanine N-acetyltransferase
MSAQLDRRITYRTLNEVDLTQVLEIENAVHAHPWTRGNFVDSIAAGYECRLAECDRALVGYVILLAAAGEAHLLNLSVAPRWQRRGIGTALTAYAVALARRHSAGKIYLEVRPSNMAARALYMRAGFLEVGVRRDYYPAPNGREDAIVMELSLEK